MGICIFLHIEHKENKIIGCDKDGKPVYEDGEWKCADGYIEDPYSTSEEKELVLDSPYIGRDYHLFAILANVRNDFNNLCISPPRGLPNDISNEVRNEAIKMNDPTFHSHSYFTLKELIDYQKNAPSLKQGGMISPQSQKALDERGIIPECYCFGTSDPTWQFREWETENKVLIPIIEILKERADKVGLIPSWEWDESPKSAYEKSEKIRIVFWFDI
ncbi:hypothetical protein GPJ56_009931 [Histomonas meleagridis]|uniref:Uncharacterized protein n=1 Tax=Histomonas meleagridis TaxID=135588 RepID=UPI00355A66C9|nr:hypothetical protein GPJ56_009931 [Histomonas meleagridis]KAH0802762.1 Uncharacterized protein GO595_004269 [Histomonas meleagridis]